MRAVVQRVSRAQVSVEGRVTGQIEGGLMILVGVGRDDTSTVAAAMAEKVANLRIFEDEQGKMNKSLLDVKGGALVVSQFTLLADPNSGRRPSFTKAAAPDEARRLYNHFLSLLRLRNIKVETGKFAATMEVDLTNEGPVTIILDTREK